MRELIHPGGLLSVLNGQADDATVGVQVKRDVLVELARFDRWPSLNSTSVVSVSARYLTRMAHSAMRRSEPLVRHLPGRCAPRGLLDAGADAVGAPADRRAPCPSDVDLCTTLPLRPAGVGLWLSICSRGVHARHCELTITTGDRDE